MKLEQDLRRAVERGDLALYYQPAICLESGRVAGAEALLHWPDGEHDDVSPVEIVQLAEEMGLMHKIGLWSLEQVCHQLAKWQREKSARRDCYISLNLSPWQLLYTDLIDSLRRVLRASAIDPRLLVLEVSETAAIDHIEQFLPVMHELRELGVQVCLDEFGAAHSSLTCLHRFPINRVKVDRTLVNHLEHKREYTAVIQAVLSFAHAQQIRVIGQGVETSEQLVQLQSLDCDEAQGFYCGFPLPIAKLEELLEAPGTLFKCGG